MEKHKSSATVLESLKKGDENAFEQLYVKHYENLCAYALNYASDKSLIQDVVQDCFLTLWKKRKSLVVNTSLKSYLYRMVYNKLMDSYRKKAKKDKMLLSYYNIAINQVVEKMDEDEHYKSERLKLLNDCINNLPKRCKEVFIAKKIKGLKHQSISEQLNISIKTIEGHVTRALSLLKACFKTV